MKNLIFFLSLFLISCSQPSAKEEIVTIIEKNYNPQEQNDVIINKRGDVVQYSATGATYVLVLQNEPGDVLLFPVTKDQFYSFKQWDRGILVTENLIRTLKHQ